MTDPADGAGADRPNGAAGPAAAGAGATGPTAAAGIARVFVEEYGRCVATLVRVLGDIDLAEEAVAEAFAVAVERWPAEGTPPHPGGWLTTTARRRAIDRLRRESTREQRQARAQRELLPGTGDDAGPPDPDDLDGGEAGPVQDDRLRLLFTCCHPALAMPARVALTLRLLGGLSTTEIARAFLVPEATMAQRLVRAKGKIARARIPYRVPYEADLPERLSGVLAVLYLVYTEGHTATAGERLDRADLAAEALRLARLVVELMPDEPEALGLLALLLLSQARAPARVSASGDLVPLAEQDRSRWDAAMIAEGHDLVRACLRRGRPGRYQIQAAIQAVHTDAASAADTDWAQVLALHDQLLAVDPSPVVALNRAVAVAEVQGPATALAVVESLAGLERYHLAHALRADLLARLGRTDEAAAAYDAALAVTTNAAEQRHLLRRRG